MYIVHAGACKLWQMRHIGCISGIGVCMLQQICSKCPVQHNLLLCFCEFVRIIAQASQNLLRSSWSCWVGVGCMRSPECYQFKAGRSRVFKPYPHCSLQYCWSANRNIQDVFSSTILPQDLWIVHFYWQTSPFSEIHLKGTALACCGEESPRNLIR